MPLIVNCKYVLLEKSHQANRENVEHEEDRKEHGKHCSQEDLNKRNFIRILNTVLCTIFFCAID